MREILFRGKAINRDYGCHRTNYKNGDWVYGLVTRLYDERFENLPAEMTNVNGIEGIEVDYKTIGQYTGLTDKNGKKIFEGDIVHAVYSNGYIGVPDTDYGNLIVGFDDTYYGGTCYSMKIVGDTGYRIFSAGLINGVTVIGNTHDNPELLKEGDGE